MSEDKPDLQSIINQNRAKAEKTQWKGSVIEYLEKVRENNALAMSAPGRLYNMIINQGTKPSQEKHPLPGYEDMVAYDFFEDQIFGADESLHDLVKFFHAPNRDWKAYSNSGGTCILRQKFYCLAP
jgi:serine protein kinase